MGVVDASELVLSPAVRVLWRDSHRIQLELGSRTVQVDGVDEATVRALTSTRPAARRPSADAHHVFATLHEMGFLWTRRAAARARRPDIPRHLAGELAALSTRYGENARDVLEGRRFASVVVQGTARTVPHIAALLGAAGVGRVYLADSGDVSVEQCAPGGLALADEGQRFGAAAASVVRAAAPHVVTGPPPFGEPADLVVVVAESPSGLDVQPTRPHLLSRVAGDHGVVGPLVVPGRSTCLRCTDLHRSDRDAAWAALSVQLSSPTRRPRPSDVSLAAVIAGVTALQTLAYIDGERPAALGGTLEVQLPDWRIRRRTWAPHPRCACGAARCST